MASFRTNHYGTRAGKRIKIFLAIGVKMNFKLLSFKFTRDCSDHQDLDGCPFLFNFRNKIKACFSNTHCSCIPFLVNKTLTCKAFLFFMCSLYIYRIKQTALKLCSSGCSYIASLCSCLSYALKQFKNGY